MEFFHYHFLDEFSKIYFTRSKRNVLLSSNFLIQFSDSVCLMSAQMWRKRKEKSKPVAQGLTLVCACRNFFWKISALIVRVVYVSSIFIYAHFLKFCLADVRKVKENDWHFVLNIYWRAYSLYYCIYSNRTRVFY